MGAFFQDGPTLGNQYDDDRVLQSYLKRRLPAGMLAEIEPGLRKLGKRAVTDIMEHGNDAETHPPVHVPYDPWGVRIDEITVSRGWKELDRIAAEEAIVATGYERKHGAWSRVHQFARILLYNPSSAIYTCPLAMTDGAARLIETYGDAALKRDVLPHLVSRDPATFWTSGQWMTERTGGSDVGLSETVAKLENGTYRLYGNKFFTSAVTAQVAMTLARIEGAPAGGKGLSLFYIKVKDDNGRLQNIQINRLKDKLGTRALPTAELDLNGTPATLVGEPGNGVKKISTLFNITRMYNAVCAVSGMRRGIALARDYARRRVAFKHPLSELPLHVETLAAMETEYEGAFHLVFRLVELLGKDDTQTATRDETAVLRLLTPIAKLYTGKQGVAVASEVVECFGGAGYMEDTGIPRILRDSQTLAIWEGTTNVLALDTLRAIEKDLAFPPFLAEIRARAAASKHPDLAEAAVKVRVAADRLEGYLPMAIGGGMDFVEAGARAFAYSLARTYTGSLLLENAQWSLDHEGDRRPLIVARRWCAVDMAPLVQADPAHRADSMAIAMDLKPLPVAGSR